ncbi:DNA-binding barrel domain superfamily [Sesbania bispinosa]|nr:DNA-binding barrel domain superfamily [Sesbania bispinosa]
MVNLPFPFEFYYGKKSELGNKVVLFDDFGHEFDVPLVFGNKTCMMFQVVDELKRFYGIEKKLHVYLKYEGGCKFRFEMKDEALNQTLTPGKVNLSGKICGHNHEVIEISSGSSEDGNVVVNEGVLGVGRQTGRVIICRKPSKLSRPVRVFSFEKPLPREIVANFIRKYWHDLILQVGGRNYSCKLLWRPGSEMKDCHLGKYWYKLVNEMELKTRDKLVFKSIMVGLNVMNVTIIRKRRT